MAKPIITAARLRELLHYDPETGVFTRKVRTAQRHQVGDRADYGINTGGMKGYRTVALDSRKYLAHRAAWLYVYGEWPNDQIDHMDGDPSNNRIANLRDVPDGVNKQNKRRPKKTSKSGFLGVYFHQNRWYARVQLNRRQVYMVGHDTPEAAHADYVIAKRKLHEGCTI